MTNSQLTQLITDAIDVRLNIPGIDDDTENAVILFMVTELVTHLPSDVQDLLVDSSDGLSPEEIERWAVKIAGIANKYIDIPKVPEFIEEQVFLMVFRACLQYGLKGRSLI